MEVLALVPARGGSKGILRKNLVSLAGKPLLHWTLDAARAAESVTRVVVTTDDGEIAAAVRDAEVLRRPPELAADDTPMLPVIRHALETFPCDVLVLLQPTSPLRRARDVDAAVHQLLESGADTVVSVVPVPHRYLPESLMELHGDRLVARAEPVARQAQSTLYARNGPAVLALRPRRLGDSLYGGDVRAYVMEARESLDIDTPFDLELAEALLARR
ncbi:MAG: acylneuraminate cytidylyltransferase family protein [Actinobacteria bacterium]|nr:MAG: acylneuraminate cytidylyltransferase family protein [Actinomycetota bacterium]